MLFQLYAPLLAIYMRNSAYLCIMVWIHMDAHEYICFLSKLEYFMYFWSTSLFPVPLWFRFLWLTGLVLITLITTGR
jgi:hypothetical protein